MNDKCCMTDAMSRLSIQHDEGLCFSDCWDFLGGIAKLGLSPNFGFEFTNYNFGQISKPPWTSFFIWEKELSILQSALLMNFICESFLHAIDNCLNMLGSIRLYH